MMAAFQEFLQKWMEIFLDDFAVQGDEEDMPDKLAQVFKRCEEMGISLNPKKCVFGVEKGVLLGHVVSHEGVAVEEGKVSKIRDLPAPQNLRQLCGFLGHANYYRRFILNFASIVNSLTQLLKKDVPYVWTVDCQAAFEEIKNRLIQAPILIPPNWSKPFHIHADASHTAVGAVLCQDDGKKIDHPIYYASRNLSDPERNYTTTEKECLSMVFAVDKFRHYLLGNHFIIYVDHQALKYLLNKADLAGRVM